MSMKNHVIPSECQYETILVEATDISALNLRVISDKIFNAFLYKIRG